MVLPAFCYPRKHVLQSQIRLKLRKLQKVYATDDGAVTILGSITGCC